MHSAATKLIQTLRIENVVWPLKRILARVGWLPVNLNIYYFFKYAGMPDSILEHRFRGTVRWANANDVSLIANSYGRDRIDELRRRLNESERCILAINRLGEVAGFGWVTEKNEHWESSSKCIFKIPEGTIYTYNWYIEPQYRLTGLWVGMMNFLFESGIYDADHGLMAYIAHKNFPSIRAHIRFGFELYHRKVILTVGSRAISFDKEFEHNDDNIRRILGMSTR